MFKRWRIHKLILLSLLIYLTANWLLVTFPKKEQVTYCKPVTERTGIKSQYAFQSSTLLSLMVPYGLNYDDNSGSALYEIGTEQLAKTNPSLLQLMLEHYDRVDGSRGVSLIFGIIKPIESLDYDNELYNRRFFSIIPYHQGPAETFWVDGGAFIDVYLGLPQNRDTHWQARLGSCGAYPPELSDFKKESSIMESCDFRFRANDVDISYHLNPEMVRDFKEIELFIKKELLCNVQRP